MVDKLRSKVLVAEDNTDWQAEIGRVLGDVAILQALNRAEALGLIDKQGGEIALVITNARMGDVIKIGGQGIAEAAQAKEIPVVILSACPELVESGVRDKCLAVINKADGLSQLPSLLKAAEEKIAEGIPEDWKAQSDALMEFLSSKGIVPDFIAMRKGGVFCVECPEGTILPKDVENLEFNGRKVIIKVSGGPIIAA